MARLRRSEPPVPTMFPNYVKTEVYKAIDYAARHHYRSVPPVAFQFDSAREHFVQPSDWPILERAAAVAPNAGKAQTYRIPVEVDGWNTNLFVVLPHTSPPNKVPFLWPEEPTRLTPERQDTPEMELVHQWAEHRAETAIAWCVVEGLIEEFDRSAQPISVLKELWPDFDMLLHAIPGRKLHADVEEWLQKFKDAPSPRNVKMPVPYTMDHLEDVRSTVLAMTLMPTELPVAEEGAFKAWLSDYKKIELPWHEWACNEGRGNQAVVSHRMDESAR